MCSLLEGRGGTQSAEGCGWFHSARISAAQEKDRLKIRRIGVLFHQTHIRLSSRKTGTNNTSYMIFFSLEFFYAPFRFFAPELAENVYRGLATVEGLTWTLKELSICLHKKILFLRHNYIFGFCLLYEYVSYADVKAILVIYVWYMGCRDFYLGFYWKDYKIIYFKLLMNPCCFLFYFMCLDRLNFSRTCSIYPGFVSSCFVLIKLTLFSYS